ncbi:MAG TPA: hypothetical protein VLN74_00725, partial [Ilumatobacteraceae bacterium]|nr:hypothetical protein [Ilumatobacteraceae bacterium]
MSWLVTSIVLSVVLTVVLNLGLRMFRGVGQRTTSPVSEPQWLEADETRTSDRRVRVWMPWKGMLL